MSVKINIDVNAILERRGLGQDMRAGKKLAAAAVTLMDRHIPMRSGTLKNSAQIREQYPKTLIIYDQPYAHYQYVGKAMGPNFKLKNGEWRSRRGKEKHYTGKNLSYSGAPDRGKEWDKRMLAAKGRELLDSVAATIGGRVKR